MRSGQEKRRDKTFEPDIVQYIDGGEEKLRKGR